MIAVVAESHALFKGIFGHADPDDIALSHVPDSFSPVDQVMDLPFENRLEIGLHLSACHFDP